MVAEPGRARIVIALTALALALPALSGCLRAGEDLLVVVSAPRESSGLTVFVKSADRLLAEPSAEYEIRYGELTVYPPGGKGATFPVEDGHGTVFVPFNLFVVGNGDYELLVRYGKDEAKARVPVDKWVSYVYLHPFDRGSKVVVDAQLSRTTGGLPNDRVITEGELVLDIRYRGKDGKLDRPTGAPVKVVTETSKSFVRIELPLSRFGEGPGYYSIEPVFHNNHAKGNLWVPKDPTLGQRNPPWNWIYISR